MAVISAWGFASSVGHTVYEEAQYDAVIARKFVKLHFLGYFGPGQGIQATNTGVYFRK